ncbi:hypothetical protein EON80_00485 [bacterium]|nr:MAG: hypothetical protein EON80_00485 [bacterium]
MTRRQLLLTTALYGLAGKSMLLSLAKAQAAPVAVQPVINLDRFQTRVAAFTARDDEAVLTAITNTQAWEWMQGNVPFFECPDPQIEEIFLFRWWLYRKHLRPTPDGWIVTEFLPDVPWAGKFNSISCPAGHHFYEGRWLRDSQILDDYARFWFEGGEPRRYSFWVADAIYQRALATGDWKVATDLLPDLVANWRAWEKSNGRPNGLFTQIDDRDGMEFSSGGSGFRPTINSYQYGDARAIEKLARRSGDKAIAQEFGAKADKLKTLVETKLWDKEAQFFKTLPEAEGAQLVRPREQVGFVPWYFSLPSRGKGFETAWRQIKDPSGFAAPYGPTTVEQRDPSFMVAHPHDCLWNGPSWPFATTQTLVALANVLHDYHQDAVTNRDYFELLKTYTRSQYKDGHPWLAEDLDAHTGKWIVDLPRSIYYNHSGYCDLVISGLVGLTPRDDQTVEVRPLLPPGTWDYFCLQDVPYHGHLLTILWDANGTRYGRGKGLIILADGQELAHSSKLKALRAVLPEKPISPFRKL